MCRLYETNIFGAGAVLGMDASCDWGGVVTRAYTLCIGQGFFALWLSQLCQEVGVEVLMVRFDKALLLSSVCPIPKDMFAEASLGPVWSQQTSAPPMNVSSIHP